MINENDTKNQKRYAVYYAPKKGSRLDQFGCAWLGRDAASNRWFEPAGIPGLSKQQVADMIKTPAHYGFHGTLKPPFSLESPDQESGLICDIKELASQHVPFLLPPLQLFHMGAYIALMPHHGSLRLERLADQCVRFLDAYRKPETESRMNMRRKAGLNSRQEDYLVNWGYPYVLKEFRFHLTLVGPIENEETRQHVYKALENRLKPAFLNDVMVDSICLFVQENRKSPFYLHTRFDFKAADE